MRRMTWRKCQCESKSLKVTFKVTLRGDGVRAGLTFVPVECNPRLKRRRGLVLIQGREKTFTEKERRR